MIYTSIQPPNFRRPLISQVRNIVRVPRSKRVVPRHVVTSEPLTTPSPKPEPEPPTVKTSSSFIPILNKIYWTPSNTSRTKFIPHVPFDPHNTKPVNIKGVSSDLAVYGYKLKLTYQMPVLYSSEWMVVKYFPSDHYFGIIRKSDPAILLTYGPGMEYNGNPEYSEMGKRVLYKTTKTKNPMNYAYHRHAMLRQLRNALHAEIKSECLGPDANIVMPATEGVFNIKILKYPNNFETLVQEMKNVMKFWKLQLNSKQPLWSNSFNRNIKWAVIKREMEKAHYSTEILEKKLKSLGIGF